MSAHVSQLKSTLAALAVAAALLGTAQGVRADPAVYNRALKGTGLVLVPLAGGQYSFGSCWVVDRQQKLVVTNYHVVRDNNDVRVVFPQWKDGSVVTETQYYWTAVGHL